MRLKLELAGEVEMNGAGTVIVPLEGSIGDKFSDQDWECDRAWAFAQRGSLIVWDGRIDRISDIILPG